MADDPWADDPHDPDAHGGDAPRFDDDRAEDGPHADLGTYASDREVEAPNPKKSVGTGVKALVALLLGGGLLAALCCGAGVLDFVTAFEEERTPAGVRARTDELLTIALPDDYSPRAAYVITMPIARWMADQRLDSALYDTPGGGRFEVTKMRFAAQVAADPAAQRQMEDQHFEFLKQRRGFMPIFKQTRSDTRTLLTADGRSVDWTFSEGFEKGMDDARQISGTIEDDLVVYTLRWNLPTEEYDEEEVVAMLESIELVDPQTEPVPPGKEDVMEEADVDPDAVEPADVAENDAEPDADAAAESDAEPVE